ncbi:MAG: aspartate 1-decarboxylase, partial [Bacteroidota bacterium]
MLIHRFKGKIHRVAITEANLNYVGSITIDGKLLDAAGIMEGDTADVIEIGLGNCNPMN